MTSGVGLKFQSSIPMESGLTVEIFARLFNPVSLRGTLTKLKRFEIGSFICFFRQMQKGKTAAPAKKVFL
jgi:hypothetical protein